MNINVIFVVNTKNLDGNERLPFKELFTNCNKNSGQFKSAHICLENIDSEKTDAFYISNNIKYANDVFWDLLGDTIIRTAIDKKNSRDDIVIFVLVSEKYSNGERYSKKIICDLIKSQNSGNWYFLVIGGDKNLLAESKKWQ